MSYGAENWNLGGGAVGLKMLLASYISWGDLRRSMLKSRNTEYAD